MKLLVGVISTFLLSFSPHAFSESDSCIVNSCANNMLDQFFDNFKAISQQLACDDDAPIVDPFYNPEGVFFKDRAKAQANAPLNWEKLSDSEKGQFIYDYYKKFIEEHQFDKKYHSKGTYKGISYDLYALTCKSFKESSFDSQIKTSGKNSSAAGLTQVTEETLKDLLKPSGWFKSKVKCFSNVKFEEFLKNLPKSPVAQIEIGLAVIRLKELVLISQNKTYSMKTILQYYYSPKKTSVSVPYANKIMRCAKCLSDKDTKKDGSIIDVSCFNMK